MLHGARMGDERAAWALGRGRVNWRIGEEGGPAKLSQAVREMAIGWPLTSPPLGLLSARFALDARVVQVLLKLHEHLPHLVGLAQLGEGIAQGPVPQAQQG